MDHNSSKTNRFCVCKVKALDIDFQEINFEFIYQYLWEYYRTGLEYENDLRVGFASLPLIQVLPH